jgi:hypothetical protein
MFRLLRSITLKQCFSEQIPVLVGAALLAEGFYKFHSFLLETVAFLATWFVLDLLLEGVVWVIGILSGRAKAPASSQAIHPRAEGPGVFFGGTNDRVPGAAFGPSDDRVRLTSEVTGIAVDRQGTGPGIEPPPNRPPSGTIPEGFARRTIP